MFNEYNEVLKFYGDRRAYRSGLPYMQHINEGLYVLSKLGGSPAALRAFCLHPLIQGRDDFQDSVNKGVLSRAFKLGGKESAEAVALAIEYRYIANAYTSRMPPSERCKITRSPLEQVNLMLKADKIQNYKDALLNVVPKYPEEASRLFTYFEHYMDYFEISAEEFKGWIYDLVSTFPLNMDANTYEDVERYFTARLATWLGYAMLQLVEVEGGVQATIMDRTSGSPRVYQAYYIYAKERGKGHYKRWAAKGMELYSNFRVITERDCGIVDYLTYLKAPHKIVR